MAKAFVILLTVIYTFSATGATVHLHDCCGELQKLVMPNAHKEPVPDDCSLCVTHPEKKHQDTTCCIGDSNDRCEVKVQKITGEHLPSVDNKLAKVYPLELLVFTLAHVIDPQQDTFHAVQMADSGPPNGTTPLFIQHCTYRI